ncbi:CRAL_TRIO domain-containing protein [Cephalotus follicularis]|uniref:CRAL_TRIO domain-containing protein n=1 Tax=Cephalotus follicularis TaxID=3775 RepID=A0A1Q3AQR5_CEPFO|nr:CRAL_TRIO domain-containing protein [Cephalotus follicularis]
MGERSDYYNSSRNSEATSVTTAKKGVKSNLVASAPKAFPQNAYGRIASLSHRGTGSALVGDAAIFLLKVSVLEIVRRVSRAKCPYMWRGIQGLQLFCYPPLKWIQRWAPFKVLVKGLQDFSRPLLFLSIATTFSDHSEYNIENSDSASGSHVNPELQAELPSIDSAFDTRIGSEPPEILTAENWLIQLLNELESQGICLPERINEDELCRFYTAANGDFSCFLSSVKKTIRWRETYRILSEQELKIWSDVVFWHGFDVMHRPCLIVRLGVACLNLPSHERPRFAQAVISQVEHGVLHLVDAENPQIMVLVDCEGLYPLKIPMQMLRSCSSVLQDHFPDRLAFLFIIRLHPVVRVIAQTFLQVVKPNTRKKIKITGEMYQKVLLEYLQTLPTYLGGNCTCTRCSSISNCDLKTETYKIELEGDISDGEDLPSPCLAHQADGHTHMNANCNQVLRSAVIFILMLWAFIALIAGIYDPEGS